MANKLKILAVALIVLFAIPLVMAELFKNDLKETAKGIYFGTLNFFANAFLPIFLIIASILVALIIILILTLAGRILNKIGR